MKPFAQISNDIDALTYLNKTIGIRLDLTQAGGGNISIKTYPHYMRIKSSGTMLFDDVCTTLLYKDIDLRANIKDDEEGEVLNRYIKSGGQPSLETWFHCVTRKYTVHCHPIAVIEALAKYDNELKLKKKFDCQIVDYIKPGKHLLREITKDSPEIIFLKNHGLIVNSDSLEETLDLLRDVTDYCEELTGLNFYIEKRCSNLQRYIYNVYGSLDYIMPIDFTPVKVDQTPDCLVYTKGLEPLEVEDEKSFTGQKPTVIKYYDNYYVVSSSYVKCHETADILRMYSSLKDARSLTSREASNILGWASEKLRS